MRKGWVANHSALNYMLRFRQKQVTLEKNGLLARRGELDDDLKLLIDKRAKAVATSEGAQRE